MVQQTEMCFKWRYSTYLSINSQSKSSCTLSPLQAKHAKSHIPKLHYFLQSAHYLNHTLTRIFVKWLMIIFKHLKKAITGYCLWAEVFCHSGIFSSTLMASGQSTAPTSSSTAGSRSTHFYAVFKPVMWVLLSWASSLPHRQALTGGRSSHDTQDRSPVRVSVFSVNQTGWCVHGHKH